MAHSWNGRMHAIIQEGAPVTVQWNEAQLATDVWAIPKGAANAENAQKFAAFITLPVSQARLSYLIPYGSVNNASAELMTPEQLESLPTAPAYLEQDVRPRHRLVGREPRRGARALERVDPRVASLMSGASGLREAARARAADCRHDSDTANGKTRATGETIGELGARVIFDQIEKRYGSVVAVDGVSLDIAPGEFVTLLGPSGSGKTTTLMMLAGFEIPTAGEIYVDEDPIAAVPPYRRNIGMVFQNYALFPHMTVGENIAFPLQMRKMSRAEITRQTTAVLAAGRSARLRGTLSAPALGRAAAAGRRGASARLQPARAADGRAAGRARQAAPRALAARDQGAPRAARRDHHLRHPRPGRSAGHVGPHRGDERRPHRAVRATHRAL